MPGLIFIVIMVTLLRPVFKHSKLLGFLNASQESEMQILFQNCMQDKFAYIAHRKVFFNLIKETDQNYFSKRLENRFSFYILVKPLKSPNTLNVLKKRVLKRLTQLWKNKTTFKHVMNQNVFTSRLKIMLSKSMLHCCFSCLLSPIVVTHFTVLWVPYYNNIVLLFNRLSLSDECGSWVWKSFLILKD